MPSDANFEGAYLLSDTHRRQGSLGGKADRQTGRRHRRRTGQAAGGHAPADRPAVRLQVADGAVGQGRAARRQNGRADLSIAALEPYEGEPAEGQICLRDHLLDKKVLDSDDDEVEVVYDVKLAARNGRLYVTDVDFRGPASCAASG